MMQSKRSWAGTQEPRKAQRFNFSFKSSFWNILLIYQLLKIKMPLSEKLERYDHFQPTFFIIIPSVCWGTDSCICIWTPAHLSSPWYQEDCLSVPTSLKDAAQKAQQSVSRLTGWRAEAGGTVLSTKKRPFPCVFRHEQRNRRRENRHLRWKERCW